MKPEYFVELREDLKNKKVLIASPFYEYKGYCTNSYFVNLKNMKWKNKNYFFVDNSKTLDFMNVTKDWLKEKHNFSPTFFHTPYVSTSRKRQVFSYNKIREVFLEGDYDYLFIVESDLFPHPYMLELLMRWDKDLVSGVYRIGTQSIKVPCVTTDAHNLRGGKFGSNFLREYQIDGSLRKIPGGTGFGCILIKRKVLEQIKFRSGVNHADTYFHEDCAKFGFERWVDTSQVILHDPSEYHDF